jgi:predicted Fe-Mo cluster-binding NifX family protein
MSLRFALAINKENRMGKMHFGDAERFLIYTLEDGKMILSSKETNDFKIMDDENEKELNQKGIAIVNFLKEKNVHVLVSERSVKQNFPGVENQMKIKKGGASWH